MVCELVLFIACLSTSVSLSTDTAARTSRHDDAADGEVASRRAAQLTTSPVAHIIFSDTVTDGIAVGGFGEPRNDLTVVVLDPAPNKGARVQGWQTIHNLFAFRTQAHEWIATSLNRTVFVLGLPQGTVVRFALARAVRGLTPDAAKWHTFDERLCTVSSGFNEVPWHMCTAAP